MGKVRGMWHARLEESGLRQAGLAGMLGRPRAAHRVLAVAQRLAIPAASAELFGDVQLLALLAAEAAVRHCRCRRLCREGLELRAANQN